MRVLVLGAGGIGGYYGGRLAQAGVDTSFLVRPARAERLAAEGLRIQSPHGDATLDVRAIVEAEAAYDLVVLSCKAYDLADAVAAIRPAVGATTLVLPLLNGLAHLAAIDAAFGSRRILGGLAAISVALRPDGAIRQFTPLQSLTFGAREPAQADGCDAVEAVLRRASFDVRRSADVMQDMWEKFAFITAASGITCLMRAAVGAIVASADGAAATTSMLEECEAVAAASGHPVRDKAKAWARGLLLEKGSAFTASMLRDLEAGFRVEADHLQGDMIARGAALGIEMPLLRAAYAHLQAYEARGDTKGKG